MTLPADMKLTPWISGDITPEREGLYLRDYGHGWCRVYGYAMFRDGAWLEGSPNRLLAACSVHQARHQHLPWRGLAEPPK